ncbi:hypothetical protein NQ315_010807 [Exocentrus adspersus]|uniref:Methionine--tRNA ligase, mitochondrial n=1 Tax=Exocentrus adspersus TaxID=1586481 RepID=A0AAV8V9G1_9CUCU|nr:hypothetical protein NQ315_010807 [Exocentrus adspersus]
MCSKKLSLLRHYSAQIKTIGYYTTPIYYVNADPHIGHLYTSLIADAAQRWHAILNRGAKIKFSTGTDEHGSKIQQAASTTNLALEDYCNDISKRYKSLAELFGIGHTHFIRTTDESHKKTVQNFWKLLNKNGHIYSSTYSGWYCVSDESFLTDSQLKEVIGADGRRLTVSSESGHPVEWTEEPNYMFRLHSFREDLIYWLTRNDKIVRPKIFQKILLDLLDDDLPDVSISRPSSRVHWGVRVPGDDTQTVYVWLDALTNYLTVAGYSQDAQEFRSSWPPDVQVIGKDILKFHGIYWPAFLMAADLEPPRSILCHSHWTVNGEKMSKSKGNVVCPFDRSTVYTTDGLRYFLLREGVAHSDGNYSDTKVIRILNSELADTFGNLLSRCCGGVLNPGQIVPGIEAEVFESVASLDVTKKLIENIVQLPDICKGHYQDLNFYRVADSVVATLHSANLFFETLKPWELKKHPEKCKELDVVLHLAIETLRVTGILLQPIIPNICNDLLNKISVGKGDRFFENAQRFSWMDVDFKESQLAAEKVVLFKRILLEGDKKS